MPYCDSAELERHWFLWLVASCVPALETYRKAGLLWTRITGTVNGNHRTPPLPDPLYPIKLHCIALARPIYFISTNGELSESVITFDGSEIQETILPSEDELNLLSDSPIHLLDRAPLAQMTLVVPRLIRLGYFREVPTLKSWNSLLEGISMICQGVATRFRPKSDEELMDLASESLLHIMHKLRTRRLVYTPGRAPVFNLLTTTIHRIIYSTLNRRKRHREGLRKFMAAVQTGVLPKTRAI